MSPNEIDILRDLINTFKQDVHKELEKLTTQIEKLNNKIETFNEKSNETNIKIGVIEEKQTNLKSSIKNNFDQHTEFYDRLNKLERLPNVSQKTEDNENEIIKIKSTARTAYIAFGVIITILGLLFKFGVI